MTSKITQAVINAQPVKPGASNNSQKKSPSESSTANNVVDQIPSNPGAPWLHDVKPLSRKIPEAENYPVEALPMTLQRAVQSLIKVIQAPPALCAHSVLAATTLVVQPIADVEIDGRRFPPSMYFLSIAESGERKSAVDKVSSKPIREHEAEQFKLYRKELKNYEIKRKTFESAVKVILNSKKSLAAKTLELEGLGACPDPPLSPIRLVSDPTVEGLCKLMISNQPSLGLFSDEAGRMIGGHSMNDDNLLKTIATLSKWWDGDPPDRVRAGDGVSKEYGKRLSMHLQAQSKVAAILLSNPLVNNQGLLARCLIIFPGSTAGQRSYCDMDLSKNLDIQEFWDVLKAGLERPPRIKEGTQNELDPKVISPEPKAKILYREFHDEVEKELGPDGQYSSIRAFASKAPEHCLRMAAVFALVRNVEASQIYEDDVEAACIIVRFYLKEALRLASIGESAHDPEFELAERLWQWLQLKRQAGQEVISLVEIYQFGPNSIRNARRASKLMMLLHEHGLVRPSNQKVVFQGRERQHSYEIRES